MAIKLKKALYFIPLFASIFSMILSPLQVFADNSFYSSNDILFYDQNASAACSSGGGTGSIASYKNPLTSNDSPDPGVFIDTDGTFYMYTSGIQKFTSQDGVHWTKSEVTINGGTKSGWAPDISRVGSNYVLTWANPTGGINYATGTSAGGPFNYKGMLESGNPNMIDPQIFSDNGKYYLYYTVSTDIMVAPITINGDHLSAGASQSVLHRTNEPWTIEAPYVINRSGTYYLFYSTGKWDGGAGFNRNNYDLRVARSSSPTGGFAKDSGPILQETSGAFTGPGTASVVTDSSGQDWLYYHARQNGGDNREVMLDRITYTNGWPVINGGNGPSSTQQQGSGGSGAASSSSSSTCCSTSGATIAIQGSNSTDKAWNYLTSNGLTPEQAAGIMGNIYVESKFNPQAGKGGSYTGISQWDTGGRWAALVSWAKGKGLDPWSFDTQLAYTVQEGTQRGNISGIKQYSDVAHTTWYWGRFFEGAIINGSSSTTPLTNVQALSDRTTAANSYYAHYAKGSASQPSGAASVTTSSSSCGSSTDSSGFVYYSQYDPTWVKSPYGTSTVGESGCGPTSVAMVVSSLTKQSYTPDVIAAKFGNYYISGQGTIHALFINAPKQYGLKSTDLGLNQNSVISTLQNGGYVITSGTGAYPYTSAGHIVVIRGMQDGKFLLGNSYPKNDMGKTSAQAQADTAWYNTEYSWSDLVNAGITGAWGITK